MQSASDTPSSHLWEWCEAGIELAMMWRSATDAGRTGAQRLSPSAVILGTGMSQNVSRARRHSGHLFLFSVAELMPMLPNKASSRRSNVSTTHPVRLARTA